MATAQATLTPTTNTAPAVVSIPAGELSGVQWVSRFPTSTLVTDCVAPFSSNLVLFIAALEAAGATVTIAATFRPPERAYLMHWCWRIVNASADPRTIPPMTGVNVRWDHADASGAYSATASMSAARAMVNGYGMQNLAVAPALNSRHTMGLAVDMNISWTGNLAIAKADGMTTTITTEPKTGMNTDLHAVGATYAVIKFIGGASDKPHWSDNGH